MHSYEVMVTFNEQQERFCLYPYSLPPLTQANIRMPYRPKPYFWGFGLYNTANFGISKESNAHDQVCLTNRQRISNSNTEVLNVPTKTGGKVLLIYL